MAELEAGPAPWLLVQLLHYSTVQAATGLPGALEKTGRDSILLAGGPGWMLASLASSTTCPVQGTVHTLYGACMPHSQLLLQPASHAPLRTSQRPLQPETFPDRLDALVAVWLESG